MYGAMASVNVADSRIFQDLVEYTNIPPQIALKRCQYAAIELAVLWTQKKSIEEYYKNTDLYLFDLTQYQLLLQHHKLIVEMIEQIKRIGTTSVLEFGGGIGEFSIVCAENSITCTYYDIGKTKEYAVWRFKKHHSTVTVAEHDPLDTQDWDVVNVMDVLEHLEHAHDVIEILGRRARYIFCNPDEIKYNEVYPQHISKYDITTHFVHVQGYLWRNKQWSSP
jgi:hypothetical protein